MSMERDRLGVCPFKLRLIFQWKISFFEGGSTNGQDLISRHPNNGHDKIFDIEMKFSLRLTTSGIQT